MAPQPDLARATGGVGPVDSPDPAPEDRDRIAGPRGRGWLFATWLILLTTLVRWRLREFYDGGVDPVVAAKGLLGVTALAMSFSALLRCRDRRPVGTRTLWFVLAYVAASTLGGWAAGDTMATGVLAFRVLLVAATVYMLVIAYPVVEVLRTLFGAMVTLAGFAAVTGVHTLAAGRLSGGIPPLQSNDIAMLVTPPMIGLGWRLVNRRSRSYDVPAVLGLLGILWLSGSRTALAAVVVSFLLLFVQSRRIAFGTLVAGVAAVPAAAIVLSTTSLVSGYVERDGTGNVGTLNSRTIAWNAAFTMPGDFWHHWFGGGFTVVTVPVSGTYWDTQVLDSSWVSGYVQAGAVGMSLMAAVFLLSLIAVFRARRAPRALWAALLVNTLITSITTSGLIGSRVLFVSFFVAAVLSEPSVRASRSAARSASGAARYAARSGQPAGP